MLSSPQIHSRNGKNSAYGQPQMNQTPPQQQIGIFLRIECLGFDGHKSESADAIRQTDMQEDHQRNTYKERNSPKQNLCLYLGKNIRRIVTQNLSSNSHTSIQFYLRFMLKNLKNTRKSIKQFLINQPRLDLYERFKQFLPRGMRKQTTASQIFEEGTKYVRKLVCSKQAQMNAQAKTEAKKEGFRLFVQRTIRELRENRMRGKDVKHNTKQLRNQGDQISGQLNVRISSSFQIVTSLPMSNQTMRLVDLQQFNQDELEFFICLS